MIETTDPAAPETYNDGCTECGHWKDFDLITADDGSTLVDCHKCGHQWPADPVKLALNRALDWLRAATDADRVAVLTARGPETIIDALTVMVRAQLDRECWDPSPPTGIPF